MTLEPTTMKLAIGTAAMWVASSVLYLTSIADPTMIAAIVAIVAGIPAILLAWAKVKEAAAAAAKAADLAQANLQQTKEVAIKVNGHWAAIEARLTLSDAQNAELLKTVRDLTATVAKADLAAAVANAETTASERAELVKAVSDLEIAAALQAPAPNAAAVPLMEQPAVLKQIEANTAAIEKNTGEGERPTVVRG